MARQVTRRRRADAAALPRWITPQLTRLVEEAPDGPGWLHEIKFDGYRVHARLDRGTVRLLTRSGLDWTHKYPAIATAVASIGAKQAYLDGELCGVRPYGITSFSMIQLASDSGNAAALVFFLFDLLHLDGEDLSPRPLIERKANLAALHAQGLGRAWRRLPRLGRINCHVDDGAPGKCTIYDSRAVPTQVRFPGWDRGQEALRLSVRIVEVSAGHLNARQA